jgi:hypothetical protein
MTPALDIEPLRLKAGETTGDDLELFPDGLEMVQSFLKTEVSEIVAAQFVAYFPLLQRIA